MVYQLRTTDYQLMNKCIATSSDSNYFPGLIALLRSLSVTNPHIPVIVFDGGLTKRQRKLAGKFASVISKEPFIRLPGRGKFSYIGYNTLLKFEVAHLEYEKVLYLDSDIIVTENLDPVFDIPKEYVGVVREVNIVRNMFRLKDRDILADSIGIDWQAKGFNAGVFVLRPAEWRDLHAKAIAIVERFGEEVFSKSKDQQLLNIIFSGKLYDLPQRYNVSPLYDTDIKNPAIIHYLTECKPWHRDYPDAHYNAFRSNISIFDYPEIAFVGK